MNNVKFSLVLIDIYIYIYKILFHRELSPEFVVQYVILFPSLELLNSYDKHLHTYIINVIMNILMHGNNLYRNAGCFYYFLG